MTATMPRVLLATALTLSGWVKLAAAQSNPCALLTSAESVTHIARGRPTYNQTPDAIQLKGGLLCEYPYGGQIGLWAPPNAEQNIEAFLKIWKADKAKRHPVSGVGDKAWIMFPVPEDEYKDRTAYLVATVGQQLVTVALFAHDGAADGPIGQHCRKEPPVPSEKEDCKKVLSDTSETQESLQPAVIELAMLVVAKVRSGKGS